MMRAFLITLGIFALMVGIIAFNTYCVRQTVAEMGNRLQTLTVLDKEKTQALYDFWQKKRKMLVFSVPAIEIQSTDERMAELLWASTADEIEFARAKTLALCAVTALQRLERFGG